MTSNIGSHVLLENPNFEEAKEEVNEILKDYFKPELLNRMDEIITFNPLSKDMMASIVDKFIGLLNTRLAEQRITIQLTPAAHAFVADEGFDPTYGARPLKRFIQRVIETKVARALIGGTILPDTKVIVDAVDGEIQMTYEKNEA